MDVTTEIADRSQWYENWWLWGVRERFGLQRGGDGFGLSGGTQGENVDSLRPLIAHRHPGK